MKTLSGVPNIKFYSGEYFQIHFFVLLCIYSSYGHSQFHCVPGNTAQERKPFGYESKKQNNITKFAREYENV